MKANHLISLAVRRSGDPVGFSLLDPGEVPEGSGEPPGGGRRETSSNPAGIGKVEKIVEMRDLTPLTEFKYNALGQRCERIDKTGATVTAHHYFLIDGIRPVSRYTGGTVIANIDRRYLNQGEQRKNGAAWDGYYYTRDHLGSIREVIKSNGTLAARYDFDPYGKRSAQYQAGTYTNGCDFGFTGHVTLANPVSGHVELVLTHFRAYDPELGRWLSADPIGEVGGLNIYGYCYASPLEFIDHQGDIPILANIGFGLLGGAVDLGIQLALNGGDWGCVDWADVGISAVASGTGAGLVSVFSKASKLSRASHVIQKANSKRVPLTNYWKTELAVAQSSREQAAGAAAGFAAAQVTKKVVDWPTTNSDPEPCD